MTAEEKKALARFLDTAEDLLRGGYRKDRPEYRFEDDRDGEGPVEGSAASGNSGHVGSSATPAVPRPAPHENDSLGRIAEEVHACVACRLASGRNNAVPGEGVDKPLVLVVGEGPGADEDRTGRPFVGPAGHLLDKMLNSVGLGRERNCFIANVVKCRPPGNRDPEEDEMSACASYLDRQIALLRPKLILSVGRVPTQTLLGTTEGIGRLRGRFHDYRGIPLLPTYHPSALLRNEDLKRPAWEDLKLLRGRLQETFGDYDRSDAEA